MFFSFLRIAIRTALRQKFFTLINITGLAVGIAASILIALWILDEISYDGYFDKADRIYRIDFYGGSPQTRTPYPMAQSMVRDFPEIEKATSLTPVYGPNMSKPIFAVEYQDIRFEETSIFGADTNFFDLFSFKFIEGDPATALKVPNAVVITRSISEKYFGKGDPMGKVITVNREYPFVVAGVIENLPANIHFHFDFLISYVFLKRVTNPEWITWSDPGHYNYVLVAPGADAGQLQEKIPAWIIPLIDYGEEFNRELLDGRTWFQLTPVRDIHLKSHIRWELETNGYIAYVYIFLVCAFLILTVACINYVNLATARSGRRSKEVAVRKTAGASRSLLVYQYLFESFLQTFIAVVLAMFLVEISLNAFGSLTGKDFGFYRSHSGLILGALFLFMIVIGLLTGSYPAFYLSSFPPIRILRSRLRTRESVSNLRVVLVILQFTASIFLIIGTLTVFRQLIFMTGADLGFNAENLVVIPLKDDRIRSRTEQIRESVQKYPGVSGVTAASNVPGGRVNTNPLSADENNQTINATELSVDYDYIPTLGLNLTEGRNFNLGFGLDSVSRFILNETAARELGFSSALNQRVTWEDDDSTYRGEIIGVVEDFHFESLHRGIAPLILTLKPAEYSYLLVRIAPERMSATLDEISREWQRFDDLFTFEYSFLTEGFGEQYRNEKNMGTIFSMMTILAVVIATLGLIGLATFTVEQMTQEIGIRKVHGATSSRILRELLMVFSKWVLLAFLIASPLAYWGMTYWLRDFYYRIPISIPLFIAAFLIAESIAILSVSFQSIRASRLKPVESLRYE